MRVLKIIHGFPPDYMAGSEVYSYNLMKQMAQEGVEVFVFTRAENQFGEKYKAYDETIERMSVHRINKPTRDYLFDDKYYDAKMDEIFENYLKQVKPDVVHIGHLSHLSTNIIPIVKKYNIPIVFTIHDFWMFCIRGQLINNKGCICEGPSTINCKECSSLVTDFKKTEKALEHMRNIISMVDVFISPSKFLKKFYEAQGVPAQKIIYSKYGFDTSLIQFNPKIFSSNTKLRFGFMGRVVPTKGIAVLCKAIEQIDNAVLHIYGNVGSQKRFLESNSIVFKGGYDNKNINEVLQGFDVLIVPSIWYENAPLVIQEAFLAGIPVITSDIGGMSELVEDTIDGFLFKMGDSSDLARVLKKIIATPEILNGLKDARGKVVSIEEDAVVILDIYKGAIK